MLQAFWYSLVLLLHVAQQDPSLQWEKVSIDAYVQSDLIASFKVQGNSREGKITYDGKNWGEYDASKRLPQAYLIRPSKESSILDSQESTDTADTSEAKDAKQAESPGVFALEISSALKQLPSSLRFGSYSVNPDPSLLDTEKTPAKSGNSSKEPAAKTEDAAKSTDDSSALKLRLTEKSISLYWPAMGLVLILNEN